MSAPLGESLRAVVVHDEAHDDLPTVAILHDLDHGDFSQVLKNAELGESIHIWSFTDLYPRERVDSERMRQVVFFDADYLIIQRRLIDLGTQTARLLAGTSLFPSAKQTIYGSFDDAYEYSPVPFDNLLESFPVPALENQNGGSV